MKTQKSNKQEKTTKVIKKTQKELLKEKENEVQNLLRVSDSEVFDNLEKIELSEISKKVSAKKLTSTNRNIIDDSQYLYNEETKEKYNFSEDKKEKSKILKVFRTRTRNKMKNILTNIVLFYKENEKENLKKELNNFDIFYKEHYKINDLKIESIFSNNIDEDTRLLVQDSLKIIVSIKK